MTSLISLRCDKSLNISWSIKAVFFKLGAINVHHKRHKMAPAASLPWQHSWIQSPSVTNQISPGVRRGTHAVPILS